MKLLKKLKALSTKEFERNNISDNYINEAVYNCLLFKRANRLNEKAKLKNRHELDLFGRIFLNKHSLYLYSILFIQILFLVLIPEISPMKQTEMRKLSYSSVIYIEIRGTGWHNIISDQRGGIPLPNMIQINNGEEKYDITNNWQEFFTETNNIKMVWNSPLTTCRNFFLEMGAVISIDLSGFDFSQVTDMGSIFEKNWDLQRVNLKNADARNVRNMSNMFSYDYNLESVDVTGLKTSSKLTLMSQVFKDCQKLKSIDLSNFVTTSVTDICEMFNGCQSVKSLDLSTFHTPALTNMKHLFHDCHNLESVDVSHLDTSKVDDLAILFENCYNLKYVDLRNFDTSKVTDMAEMFMHCHSLTSVELSSFNTESAWNMGHMFTECRSLVSLNLSNFNTKTVNYIDNMFYNCHSLKYLDVISFDTTKVFNYENMFFNTSSLISLNLSNFQIFESTNINGMTSQIKRDVLLCYIETKVTSAFIDQVSIYENSCRLMCDMQHRMFIDEVVTCAITCYTSGTAYIYQYKNNKKMSYRM